MLDGNFKYVNWRTEKQLQPAREDNLQKRKRVIKAAKVAGRDICSCMTNMKGKWHINPDGARYYYCKRCKKMVY